MGIANRLNSVFDRLIDIMRFLAGILLILVTIGVSVGVVSRYFFNKPIGWLTELSSYALLYMTFMVAAWVLKEGGHVSMDFVINRFGPRTKSILNSITSFVSALVCLVITWFGIRVAWDLFKTKYFTATMLELPKWIIIAIIFFGSFMLFIQFLRTASKFFKERNVI